MTRPTSFRSASRGWFRFRAKPVLILPKDPPLYPSNPDRRLHCLACTPERTLRSANWFRVYCPRCGAEAIEEMTAEERVDAQHELDDARQQQRHPLAVLPAYLQPLDRPSSKRR